MRHNVLPHNPLLSTTPLGPNVCTARAERKEDAPDLMSKRPPPPRPTAVATAVGVDYQKSYGRPARILGSLHPP
jgi:hypothetical protein